MLTIMALGKWLREDLKKEWKSLDKKSAEWDRLIESEEERESLEEEKKKLQARFRKEQNELRKERKFLEEKKKKFEAQQHESLIAMPKFNYHMFFNEIMKIKDAKSETLMDLDTDANEIRKKNIEIENKFYKEAFLKFFKQFPDESENLTKKYDPGYYQEEIWPNSKWAEKRRDQIKEISTEIKNRKN